MFPASYKGAYEISGLDEVRHQLANFKKLRQLVDTWITLSLEKAEIFRQRTKIAKN